MNMHEEEHELVKQSLTEALISLMDVKPFSEITVTELVLKAGVARATYYRNFSSKEQVLTDYIDKILQSFYNEYPANSMQQRTQYEHISHILDYVIKYKKQLRILHKSGLSSLYLNGMNKYFFATLNKTALTADDKFKVYAFAGAEFNIIFNWIVTGDDENTKEISSYLKRSMFNSSLFGNR
ncbi:MAG: TetR/AcrR family transcriptional regulator [Eubacteriaceae bacterium]|nr:TetR/AcrR family transcriptional regulator [Eubacteriaceae bacterium]